MFNENSNLVKNYMLLINIGEKKLEDVLNFQNILEVVASVLTNKVIQNIETK